LTGLRRDLDDDWGGVAFIRSSSTTNRNSGVRSTSLSSRTKGVFVIEVKGGMISCKDGRWKHERPGKGTLLPQRKSPETGGRIDDGAQEALREGLPAILGVLVGYASSCRTRPSRPEDRKIEPAVLVDKRNFSRKLGFFIGDLGRHWDEVYRP